MDYKRIHDAIIEHAKSQHRDKKYAYYERHHIIPKSLGGSNSKENLILLTAREHFIIHKILFILARNTNEKVKMASALKRFLYSKQHEKYNICSRQYEHIKIQHAKYVSQHLTGKPTSVEARINMSAAQRKYFSENPGHWTGKNHSKETKLKMSNSQKMENNPMYGKVHSDDVRLKISNTLKGHKKSPETIKKFKARVWSEDKKKQISEKLKLYHASKKDIK